MKIIFAELISQYKSIESERTSREGGKYNLRLMHLVVGEVAEREGSNQR